MKKLKNSVKAIIISSVAVVCVLAIVLGCVFGIKKKGDKDPNNNNSNSASAFTPLQNNLAKEINSNYNSQKTTFDVLDDVPFRCTPDKIVSLGENNYTYTMANNRDIDLVLFKKTGEGFERKSLLEEFPFTSGGTQVVANSTGYALMKNSSAGQVSFRIIYIGDFDNPVQIFETKNTEGHHLELGYIIFNDNYFGYCDFYEFFSGNLRESVYNFYAYTFQKTAYTAEQLANTNNVLEDATYVTTKFVYTDNFVANLNEDGINLLSYKDGKLVKKTFEYENAYGRQISLTSLNQYKVLVGEQTILSGEDLEGNYVYDSSTHLNSKYSYDVITSDGENSRKTSIDTDKYAKIFTMESSVIGLSESYILFMQTVNGEHELNSDVNCAYYSFDDKLVLEYTSDSLEYILYAGTNTFLTTKRIITTNNSTSAENVVEFVTDVIEGKYELYSTVFKGKYFPIRANGGLYGLMDIDGNVVLDPTKFSFRPYLFTENYAIGYHEEEKSVDNSTITEKTYWRFDFATKTYTKLGKFDSSVDFITLLNSGFDGYFENNDGIYRLKSGIGKDIIEEDVSNVKAYSLSSGGLLQLDDKYILLNSYRSISFSTSASGPQDGEVGENSSTYSEEYDMEPYASSIQPYYTINSSITIDNLIYISSDIYTNPNEGKENDHYRQVYVAPRQAGCYYTNAQVNFSWSTNYWTIITATDQKKYSYNTYYDTYSQSAWYSTTQFNFFYNISQDNSKKYIYARFNIDCDEEDQLKINSITDVSYDRAKFKIALDINGGYYSRINEIYEWSNVGYSLSATDSSSYITQLSRLPSNSGYNFEGYYTSTVSGNMRIDGDGKIWALNNVIHSSYNSTDVAATWYAHWTPIEYFIEYDYAGGEFSGTQTTSTFVNTVFCVRKPSRFGYRFAGWEIYNMGYNSTLYLPNKYKGPSSTELNAFATMSPTFVDSDAANYDVYYYRELMTTEDTVKFVALWEPNTYDISVDYYSGCSSNYTDTISFGAGFTVPKVNRLGYTFAGWTITNMTSDVNQDYKLYAESESSSVKTYIASNLSSVSVDAKYNYFKDLRYKSGTVNFSGRWTANSYTVRYDQGNGNSSIETQYYDQWFSYRAPTRTGYVLSSLELTYMSRDCVKQYALDHNLEKESIINMGIGITERSISLSTGQVDGYSFLNLRSVSGDVYINVKWTPITYKINYKLEGGSISSAPTNVDYDSAVRIPTPTKTGYTFESWNVFGMSTGHLKYYGTTSSTTSSWDSNTTSVTEVTFDYVKNLNCNAGGTVNLTAIWRKNGYNLKYDVGPRGKLGEYAPEHAIFDEPFTVSIPTCPGYNFGGWNITGMDECTHYIGSSQTTNAKSATSLKDDTTFRNLTSVKDAEVLFSAAWIPITYYINYYWDDGFNGGSAPSSAKYDQTITISNAKKYGFTFDGWYIEGMDESEHLIGTQTTNVTYAEDVFETLFKNLTLIDGAEINFYANWIPLQYGITYDFDGGGPGLNYFPEKATFRQTFFVGNPGVDKFGYHFIGWQITNVTTDTLKYVGWTASTLETYGKDVTVITYKYDPNEVEGIYFQDLQSSEDESVLFTALWDPNEYNISYDIRDPRERPGAFEGNMKITERVGYGVTFTVPKAKATGYTFIGWSLRNLSDECTHYYNSNSFESTNGYYVDPNDESQVMILNGSTMSFASLHYIHDATVYIIAHWKVNEYKITYHYMPGDIDVTTLTRDTLNLSKNLTLSKEFSIAYDRYFKLPSPTNSAADESGIEIPQDIKLIYWVFFQNPISNRDLATHELNPIPYDSPYFAHGSEQCYCVDNKDGGVVKGFWDSDCHAYAVYAYVDIKLEYYGTSVVGNINDISKYTHISSADELIKTYNPVHLPATLSNSREVVGYMISANRIDAGYLTSASITDMTFRSVVYHANGGTTIYWAYSSKMAKDLDNPIFYLYAIYKVETYTLTFKPNVPSASTYTPSGKIPDMEIISGGSITLPRQDDVDLNLIGYTIVSYTLVDASSQTHTFTPGQTFNPENYNVYKSFEMVVNFSVNKYEIRYELRGGVKDSGKSYPEEATFDSWFRVSVPSRVGYTLTRYYVTDCTVIQTRYYGESSTYYQTTTNNNNTISRTGTITTDYYFKNLNCDNNGYVTFYAEWTPIKYNVQINLGDGASQKFTVSYDEWFNIPQIQRPDYAFSRIEFRNMSSGINHNLKRQGEDNITAVTGITYDADTYWAEAQNLTSSNGATVVITIVWVNASTVSHSVDMNNPIFDLNLVGANSQVENLLPNTVCSAVKFW